MSTALFGDITQSSGNFLLTFRDNLSVSSSGIQFVGNPEVGTDKLSRNVSKKLLLLAAEHLRRAQFSRYKSFLLQHSTLIARVTNSGWSLTEREVESRCEEVSGLGVAAIPFFAILLACEDPRAFMGAKCNFVTSWWKGDSLPHPYTIPKYPQLSFSRLA
jgi:hypothetical protein